MPVQASATAAAAADPAHDAPDTASLADIYRAHQGYVWRVLGRLGVAEDMVDDAVQDVFIVVGRRLSEFEGRSSLRTWLYAIALRIARKYRERRARSHVPIVVAPTDPSEGPDEALQRRQAKALLDELLTQLDDKRREVFVLCEIEKLSAPEIAEVLELKLNTVYSRIRIARQQFEKAVRRHQARHQRREP